MPAAALALALLAAAMPEAEVALPAELVTAGTLPPGTTALTMTAGRPLSGLRLDRGFTDWLDAGVFVEGDPARFIRPGLAARVRLARSGCMGLTGKGALGLVRSIGAFGARPVAHTADAELGLQADFGLGPSCAVDLFAEAAGLFDTDFTSTRSALFLITTAGVEWAPHRKVSLLARAGEFRGHHGARVHFSGGAAVRF